MSGELIGEKHADLQLGNAEFGKEGILNCRECKKVAAEGVAINGGEAKFVDTEFISINNINTNMKELYIDQIF